MAHGSIVADGPTTEIKAMVGLRTIRATLPDVDIGELERLPGVTSAERRGDAIVLHCATPTPRSARCCRPIPLSATSRSPAPGSSRRSCFSPPEATSS